jgi:hypothetical protein
MTKNVKYLASAVAAIALAAAISAPASAQRYVRHAQTYGHTYEAPQAQFSRDLYSSNAQGHQSYSNPDRDFYGENTMGGP